MSTGAHDPAHGIENFTEGVAALRSIFAHEREIGSDEGPLVVGDIGRVRSAGKRRVHPAHDTVPSLRVPNRLHVFLIEKSHYLNHLYLVCLISFLMIFIPANRALSVDAYRRPSLRSNTLPTWGLVLLAAQIGITYFYGGLAKLYLDWLQGDPMRIWMANET